MKRKARAIPGIVVDMSQPCKNRQPFVAADGACLRCGAAQGEDCRALSQTSKPEEGESE